MTSISDMEENIVGKGENAGISLSQTTYFRLYQTKRVCKRQFQI